jgi:hypothetical protein
MVTISIYVATAIAQNPTGFSTGDKILTVAPCGLLLATPARHTVNQCGPAHRDDRRYSGCKTDAERRLHSVFGSLAQAHHAVDARNQAGVRQQFVHTAGFSRMAPDCGQFV